MNHVRTQGEQKMSGNLILHAGGWEASRAQIAAIPTPEKTDTYAPVAHLALVESLDKAATLYGLEKTGERFGLARDGAQLFAMMDYATAGAGNRVTFSIAARNSLDKSLSAAIAGGERVVLCDNRLVSGDWSMMHKHTANVWPALKGYMYDKLDEMLTAFERRAAWLDGLRSRALVLREADHVVCDMARAGAIPAGEILPVLKEWAAPTGPIEDGTQQTAWGLYNAATYRAKEWSPVLQLERTRKIGEVLASAF